jgi:CHAT domain-containing protein
LQILKKHESANEVAIAETMAYLGYAQSMTGKRDKAIKNFQKAICKQARRKDVIGEAETRVLLALVQKKSGQLGPALESLETAFRLYQQVYERVGEFTARFQMATIYASQHQDDEAGNQADEALRLAEEVRYKIPGSLLRIAAFVPLNEMYRFRIELVLKKSPLSQADQALAFDLLQRSQARALRDALEQHAHGKTNSCQHESETVLKRLKRQNQQMEYVINGKANANVLQETSEGVHRLEADLDQIEAECQAQEPRLVLLSPSAVSISEIQTTILDEQSVLIQFYLSNPHSYAWVIKDSVFKMIQLPAESLLEREIDVLRLDNDDWAPAQQSALKALIKYFAPIMAEAGNKRWIVVPDGALYYFPFSLLSFAVGGRLEVIKVPSSSAIRAIRASHLSQPAHSKLVVVADPVFDLSDDRLPHHKRIRSDRLKYAEQEALAIAGLVPQTQRRLFLGFHANLDVVAAGLLSDFEIIHFATHSLVDEKDPQVSRIRLSQITKDGRPRRGFLFLNEIYRLHLRSRLVVLSSCESATGTRDVGEGPMSLARAFLFAGSQSVVATLWKVQDEATGEFMTKFYRHMLREKLSPSEALAETQFEFRHHSNRNYRNPYYWAGIEIYGEWRPQQD